MRVVLLILLALACATDAGAQGLGGNNCPGVVVSFPAINFEQLAVSNTVVKLTASKLAGAIYAVATVETNAIRYRADAAPSATVGMPVASAQTFMICPGDLSAIGFIRQSADATLDVEYHGP